MLLQAEDMVISVNENAVAYCTPYSTTRLVWWHVSHRFEYAVPKQRRGIVILFP